LSSGGVKGKLVFFLKGIQMKGRQKGVKKIWGLRKNACPSRGTGRSKSKGT